MTRVLFARPRSPHIANTPAQRFRSAPACGIRRASFANRFAPEFAMVRPTDIAAPFAPATRPATTAPARTTPAGAA